MYKLLTLIFSFVYMPSLWAMTIQPQATDYFTSEQTLLQTNNLQESLLQGNKVSLAALTTVPDNNSSETFSTHQSHHDMSLRRYVTGVVFGSSVGFGIGHAIQGRYWPMGFVFTALKLVATGFLVYQSINLANHNINLLNIEQGTNVHLHHNSLQKSGALLITTLAVLAINIWETISVSWPPKSYKIVAKNKMKWVPTYSYNKYTDSHSYGLGLRYQF